MRRRYGLCVRCCAVVEVHLRAGLIVRLGHQFFGLLDAFRPGTYHPNEQSDDDEEYDRSGNSTCDVCEIGLVLAMWSDKRSDAPARWLPAQVLDTRTLVLTVIFTYVFAHFAGAVKTRSAFAFEV